MASDKSWDKIKALEGKEVEESIMITPHVLNLLCQCLEDQNPKWKKGTAPPALIMTPMVSESAVPLGIPQPLPRAVDAGASWKIYRPLKVGDTIHTTHEFCGIQDKSNEKGPMFLHVYRSRHENQHGELVAISTNNILFF